MELPPRDTNLCRVRRYLSALVMVSALATPAGASIWPNAVDRVERQLKSDDVGQRRRAAQRIAGLSPTVGRRLALAAMDDPDIEVRLAAQAAARHLGERRASKRVIPWLSDSDQRLRVAAAELLSWSPNPRAITALGRALADPDPVVRGLAARALGASGRKQAALPLLGHLDDSAPHVRRDVVLALARLADPRAVVPLIGKIQDGRPEVRRAVSFALGELGDSRAASALVLSLRDGDDAVRIAALEALGRLSDPQSALAIENVAASDDAPAAVRAAALGSLARLGTARALDRVVAALARDKAAMKALVSAGKKAAPRLQACVKSETNQRIADGCAMALGDVGDAAAAKVVRDALRRGAISPVAGLRALGKLKQAAHLPAVLEYLEAKDVSVRRVAVAASAQLLDPSKPDGRAVGPIKRALARSKAGKSEFVALLQLMGRTGSPRAAGALVPLAENSDLLAVRVAAVEALGHTGGKRADRALLLALEAEEGSVRTAAAIALWRSGSGGTARALLDRLERAAEQDRVAVSLALSGALSRSKAADDVARAARLLASSRGGQRDALIEALARHPAPAALKHLEHLTKKSVDSADRAKVAEAITARKDARPLLATLSADADGAVRANAYWSLGWVGDGQDVSLLIKALRDKDSAAAGNAATALGRIARRGSNAAAVRSALCKGLDSPRSAVRAGALSGLRIAAQRCGDEERRLLANDASEAVRGAAARLLVHVKGKAADRDKRALSHCAAEEVSSRVAVECVATRDALPKSSEPIGVYVIPMGQSAPAARAAYALNLADGTVRLGRADRRGQVLELRAPRGAVSLGSVDELLR